MELPVDSGSGATASEPVAKDSTFSRLYDDAKRIADKLAEKKSTSEKQEHRFKAADEAHFLRLYNQAKVSCLPLHLATALLVTNNFCLGDPRTAGWQAPRG